MLSAVNDAHLAVATAYNQPAGSAQRRQQVERAIQALGEYQSLVSAARADGRLTPTAADALAKEAANISRRLPSLQAG